MAERVLYVPSIGYCLLLTLVLDRLTRPRLDPADAASRDKQAMSSSWVAKAAVLAAIVVIALYSARCGWQLAHPGPHTTQHVAPQCGLANAPQRVQVRRGG